MNKVMVLAVHPDDETLGCGGTLLKHKASGDECNWVIGTGMDEAAGFSKDAIDQRDKEIETVTKMYDFNSVFKLGLKPTMVDQYAIREVVSKIAEVIDQIKPNVIYLPYGGDVHSDHKLLFEAAYSCIKIFRRPFIKKILVMETVSETEFATALGGVAFTPNFFVDISVHIEKKLEIMKVYKDEIGGHPFPRSLKNIQALATFRGATAGCKYAESFIILKEIW